MFVGKSKFLFAFTFVMILFLAACSGGSEESGTDQDDSGENPGIRQSKYPN